MTDFRDYILTLYHSVYESVTTEVFTKLGLFQLAVLCLVLIASYYLSKLAKRGFKSLETHYSKISPVLEQLEYFLFPLFFFIFASAVRVAFQQFGWNDWLFNIFVTYFAVRIINRLMRMLFKDAFWLQPARYIIWILAILNMLKLLDETFKLMDRIGFNYGDLHFSLLTLFKGIIAVLLAFWLADKISDLLKKNITKSERINPSLKILLNKSIRITLLVIAIIVALDYIGIKLTAFAVLGGAIGVGIGFGLQKIVSNYICGFFLLMDRSVKPGDVIEIDNTFGTIQSLSARYITVLTIEGKEHLIPNEDLITHKVVNWSHSNRFIRLSVDVGVSYKTDIPLALKLLEESVDNVNRVYKFRAPVALIRDFGNSSIDLRITFWIKDPEFGTDNIASQVRLEIWKKFKENDIEIPFPQNDVYIKSIPKKGNEEISSEIIT